MKRWIAAIVSFGLIAAAPAIAQKATPGSGKPAATTPAPKTESLVDINSATKDQLQELKGVGDARADAIIKGRPYKDAKELAEKKILPQNVYDGIKEKIVAKASDAKTTAPTPARGKATERKEAPTGATNEFKTETDAKKHCPGDTVVWANTESKIYHFSGANDYGKTKQGAYMCQKESDSSGFRAARNEKAPAKN